MDALGTMKPVISPPPVKAASVLPKPITHAPTLPIPGHVDMGGLVDAQVVEAKRRDVLVSAARNAPQPLGSQVFTMFKDASGQMVTRFRDTNSGKVTYIPEPNLLRMAGNTSGAESLVNIKI